MASQKDESVWVRVISGSGTISNSVQLQVVNSTFDISAASLPTLLNSLVMTNATLVMPASASGPSIVTTFLTPGGLTNVVNITSLPTIASYPVTFVIIQASGAAQSNMGLGLPSASNSPLCRKRFIRPQPNPDSAHAYRRANRHPTFGFMERRRCAEP